MSDDEPDSVQFHSYNHGAQKSVSQSEVGRSHVAELGTRLGPNERGFLIFVIGPDEETARKWEEEESTEAPNEATNLSVGVQMMVDPTWADIQNSVTDAISDAAGQGLVDSDDYNWAALAEAWLECDQDDIMALCLGPYLNLGFSVFCYERNTGERP